MKKGVKSGYVHNWTYRGHWRERKTGPGTWTGTFRATKHKHEHSYKGAPKRGFRIRWKITGYQDAVKTAKGTYQTNFKFKKKLVKAGYGNNIQATRRRTPTMYTRRRTRLRRRPFRRSFRKARRSYRRRY